MFDWQFCGVFLRIDERQIPKRQAVNADLFALKGGTILGDHNTTLNSISRFPGRTVICRGISPNTAVQAILPSTLRTNDLT